MTNELILYISAANDLLPERDLINRAVAEIPADLRWHIVQSPLREGEVDALAIENAFFHLLILGGDIRAPIGHEWVMARQRGKRPTCLLKRGINRTSAAIDFQKFVRLESTWEPFADGNGLRKLFLEKVGERLLKQTLTIGLTPAEYDQISEWLEKLDEGEQDPIQDRQSNLGETSIILSESRLVPKGGHLLKNDSN
ncbi:MAG: hypothetical protein AB8G95_04080 [Anaerolineae bacterium]